MLYFHVFSDEHGEKTATFNQFEDPARGPGETLIASLPLDEALAGRINTLAALDGLSGEDSVGRTLAEIFLLGFIRGLLLGRESPWRHQAGVP